MKEYTNMSNGISNGLILMYVKNGELFPVLLKEDQLALLDIVITMPFEGSGLILYPESIGKVKQITMEDLEKYADKQKRKNVVGST